MPYQGRQPGVGVRDRFIFTATTGQTSFSGNDSNGLLLKYDDAAYVDVFINGTLLVPVTDYTATTKTSVVLIDAAAANDVLEILAYGISSIADTVSALNGGAFGGNVTASKFLTTTTKIETAIFRVNDQTLSANTTIAADENANATGPLAVASGVTLTVASGGNLSIV